MSTAREQVLASIRRALATTGERRAAGEPATASPQIATPGGPEVWSSGELVARLIERLRDYGASVSTCEAPAVGATLRAACEHQGARRIVIPKDLPDAWRPEGIELIVDDGLSPQALDAADGVITGSALAIAQTGTIALDGGPDQGRRALTLIPDLHLCVVRAGRVVATLPEALELLAGAVCRGHRPITLISGPSATADIELRRVQGVHGPRRLEVLVAGE